MALNISQLVEKMVILHNEVEELEAHIDGVSLQIDCLKPHLEAAINETINLKGEKEVLDYELRDLEVRLGIADGRLNDSVDVLRTHELIPVRDSSQAIIVFKHTQARLLIPDDLSVDVCYQIRRECSKYPHRICVRPNGSAFL